VVGHFEFPELNELWQMDFKGDVAMDRGRCHPLTVLDDHSRYSLGLIACTDETDETARGHLTALFRRYGLPAAMLSDNGSSWGGSGSQDYTGFAVWLMRVGIRLHHSRAYHCQTQGKDERFHRSLKVEMLQMHRLADLVTCQAAFAFWRTINNEQRPHEGDGHGGAGEPL
jgi:transposase InsO family protein